MHGVDVHASAIIRETNENGGNKRIPAESSISIKVHSNTGTISTKHYVPDAQQRKLLNRARLLAKLEQALANRIKSTQKIAIEAFEWLNETIIKDVNHHKFCLFFFHISG